MRTINEGSFLNTKRFNTSAVVHRIPLLLYFQTVAVARALDKLRGLERTNDCFVVFIRHHSTLYEHYLTNSHFSFLPSCFYDRYRHFVKSLYLPSTSLSSFSSYSVDGGVSLLD